MSELSDLGNDVKVESEVENPEKSDVDYGDGDGVNDFYETNNEMRQDSSDFNYQEGSDSDVPGDGENPDPDMSSEEKAEDIDTGIQDDIPAETETSSANDVEINTPEPEGNMSSEERADAYTDEFEDDSDETDSELTGTEETQQAEDVVDADSEESGEGDEATNQDEAQADSTDNVADGSENDASSEHVENEVTADEDVNSSVDDVEDQTGNTAADGTEDNKSADVKSESDDSATEDVGDHAEDSDGSEVSESGQEDAAASEETGVEDDSSEVDGDSTDEQGNEEKNDQDTNEETASEKVDGADNFDDASDTQADDVTEDSTDDADVKGDEAGESVDDSAEDGAEDSNTAETNSEDNAESVSGEDNDNVETSDDVESSETENATAETNDDAAEESSSNDVSDESAGEDTDEAENAVEADAEGSENNNEGDNAEGFEVDGTDGEVTEDNTASDNNGENQSESSADEVAENNSADETKNESSEKTSEDTTDQKETSDTDETSESDNNDDIDESGENEATEGVNDESGAEQNGETSSENNDAMDSENEDSSVEEGSLEDTDTAENDNSEDGSPQTSENVDEGSSADGVDEGAEDDNSDNNEAKSESGLDTEESDNQSGVSDTNEESKNINETDDSNKNVEDNRAEIDAHNESDANQDNDATDANQQASANDTSFDGTEANPSTTPIEDNATGEFRSVETEKRQILENCSYHQGQNDVGALGTCGPTSIANSLNRVTGTNDYTENKVLHNALDNNLCHKSDNPYSCGGTTTRDVVSIIDNVKDPESNIHTEVYDYDKALDVDSLADRLDESGTVAMVGVDSATLWDQRGDVSNSGLFAGYSEAPSDHWITVDSPVRDENGNVTGFNIVDSGGGVDFVDRDKFEKMYQGDDSHKVSDPTAIIVSNKGDNVNTFSQSDNVARAANYKGSAEISSGNDPPEIKNSSRDINGIELSDAAKEVNARFSGENFRAEKSFEATLSESDKDKTIDANKKTTCGLNENLGGTLDNAKFASNVDAKDLKDIKELRTRVPEIDQDTVMQKVIPADSVGKYLDGSFTQVGGCVAKANDAAPYTTNGEAAYKNLRLDYPGTKYEGFQSGEDMYVIRFKYTDDYVPSNSDIPLQADNKPPCTGTGFLGSEEHLIPEYTHDYTDISDGAIYKIDKDGNEIMVAMWDPFENKFTDKITGE